MLQSSRTMKAVLLLSIALVTACPGNIDSPNPGVDASGGGGTDAAVVDAPSGTGARVQITATSSPSGGQYAPRNVVAVWIESNRTFVKTIQRWSNARTRHLVAWNLAAGAGDADAVSGATRQNHATPLAITWDLRNRQGAIVPDGTYTIRMESTDLNATTAGQNHQATFSFVKGAQPATQSGQSNGGFSAVTIDFKP